MAEARRAGRDQRPKLESGSLPAEPVQDAFHALPLQDVLRGLAITDVGRLLLAERGLSKAVQGLKQEVLARRGMPLSWGWRKARAAEAALFGDPLGNPLTWTPGPNERGPCNLLEGQGGAQPWLWLSGGTDWQGFQGGFRCVSEDGIRPTWVTFRVRVATPELSGAFLTLAGGQHLWGLADPVLVFGYRGDDCASHRRCFSVQPYSKHGSATHYAKPAQGVTDDQPHDIALHLDWRAGLLSVYVDGENHINQVPFKASTPIRFVAIYNWRSGARTAFSELLLGRECPCERLHSLAPKRASTGPPGCASCRRRCRSAPAPAQASLAVCGALLAAAAAIALQWAAMQ